MDEAGISCLTRRFGSAGEACWMARIDGAGTGVLRMCCIDSETLRKTEKMVGVIPD